MKSSWDPWYDKTVVLYCFLLTCLENIYVYVRVCALSWDTSSFLQTTDGRGLFVFVSRHFSQHFKILKCHRSLWLLLIFMNLISIEYCECCWIVTPFAFSLVSNPSCFHYVNLPATGCKMSLEKGVLSLRIHTVLVEPFALGIATGNFSPGSWKRGVNKETERYGLGMSFRYAMALQWQLKD